jgi:segregation and condensation protein B
VRRGFELREVGGGWRIYVRPEFDDIVRDFVLTQNPSKLSQAALETLAVIGYKQPISRGAIASIRAVNVDSVVRTLLGRGLITEAFTDSETGAIHYATTDLLLTQLGVNSVDDLPHISPLLSDGSDGFDEQR